MVLHHLTILVENPYKLLFSCITSLVKYCACVLAYVCKDISCPLLLVLLITCQNFLSSSQHVPRINGEIPSVDEATSDHERLLNRYCIQILLLQIKQNSFSHFVRLGVSSVNAFYRHVITITQLIFFPLFYPFT